ncbi:hybrid sensor histidine kinase/response regulator [Asticcacaulis sp. EMRT-3]|uniref:ATP-binding response regulator n=1 Tax=Asticcacaulis sp. EMRT-3 TaxID=3040349 RepID=UPI0024AF45AC|nr:hybrid sensor histidine kinase/response regulator [Asticcacaulis sp. EMRT-3]MDI7774939.1 ATP-binding protein [Asticcacaulis sp. EMRT-3]
MNAIVPTSGYAPKAVSAPSRDEVVLDYGLKAQTRLGIYAAGFFGIGLPLLLWVGHFSLPDWLLGVYLAVFTINWSVFLGLRAALRRLEHDPHGLKPRLSRHFVAGGMWALTLIGISLSTAVYGLHPEMLLMICAGTAAGIIFFSAPVLICLLILGPLAMAGPLLALQTFPHDPQITQIMTGGLALALAMGFVLNRHMQEHYLLEHGQLELAREREMARTEAQAQTEARMALMETLSREVQTGLKGIEQNLLQGLTHLTRAPAPRQYVDSSLVEISHLQTILTTTFDNDTAASGRIELDTRPLDIDLICRKMMAQFNALAQSKGLIFSYNAEALPASGAALGDEHRVEQVLAHLLSNALLYTRQGRVELKLASLPEGLLRIEVVDSGPGLNTAELAQVFRPHVRIARTSAGSSGAGLGLSLSRSLAELMGGHAGGESTLDVGSKFWLDLPFDTAASAPPRPAEAETAAASDASLRVLLIANDSLHSHELRDALEHLGHKCLTSTSRERGLSLARKAEIDACVISLGRVENLEDETARARLAAFAAALRASQKDAGDIGDLTILILLPDGDQAESLQALGYKPLLLPQSPESLARALIRVTS